MSGWSHWRELKVDIGKGSGLWSKDNQINWIGHGRLGHSPRSKQDRGQVLERCIDLLGLSLLNYTEAIVLSRSEKLYTTVEELNSTIDGYC